jgi:hypothetical protein
MNHTVAAGNHIAGHRHHPQIGARPGTGMGGAVCIATMARTGVALPALPSSPFFRRPRRHCRDPPGRVPAAEGHPPVAAIFSYWCASRGRDSTTGLR